MPTRILVLNERDWSNPASGGAEVHLREIFGRLAKRGYRVTLAACAYRGSSRREWSDGVEILRLGRNGWHYARAMAHVARATRSGAYDLVVDCLNRGIYFAPLLSAVPVLAVCHHLVGENAFVQAPWLYGPAVWLAERAIPAVYGRTPIVAISPSTRDDLIARGLPPEHVRVVEVGVVPPRAEPLPMRERPQRVVFVGRLVRYKRVDVLLAAVARLAQRLPGLCVDVVGRGPDSPRLARIAARLGIGDRAHFHGFVSDAERDRLLASARATVCPSNLEGFCLSILEVNALGTPALASDAPGLRDAVRDGETGFVVPVDDADALAARIAQLAEDDALAERLSRGARAWAARFDWERASQRIEESIRSLEPAR